MASVDSKLGNTASTLLPIKRQFERRAAFLCRLQDIKNLAKSNIYQKPTIFQIFCCSAAIYCLHCSIKPLYNTLMLHCNIPVQKTGGHVSAVVASVPIPLSDLQIWRMK
ncbi:hypothetical protein V8Z74_24090 [Comamonas sp. w2-DMI]|uniref:hypothetical protein n=1 Tax=Comamonas sp. w2-DMI TaxID=3126391 RepID=UPI0032E4A3D0